MATYNVSCYFNTGFSATNIPSSPSVLELAEKKTFESIWKKQDRGLTRVKIKVEWDEIKDCDYVSIGMYYYTVSDITQLNGVAILTLEMDAINSVGGVNGFSILDGWVVRASHKTNEMFANIIDEPFTPRKELYMDRPVTLVRGDYDGAVGFIGSTVEITNMGFIARVYFDAAKTSSVTVPELPTAVTGTNFNIDVLQSGIDNPWPDRLLKQFLPNMAMYLFKLPAGVSIDLTNVYDGLTSIRSLNSDQAIVSSYAIPLDYISPPWVGVSEDNRVSVLHGTISIKRPTSLPYRYGGYTPKNNKVYAMYNTYHVMSMASGNSAEYGAESLYSGGAEPDFYVYADPGPEGKPYCQPTYYQGAPTDFMQLAVSGSPWLTTPYALGQKAGWLQDAITLMRTSEDLNRQYITGNLQQGGSDSIGAKILRALGGTTGAYALDEARGSGVYEKQLVDLIGSSIGGESMVNNRLALERARFDFATGAKLATPTMFFGRNTEAQGYTGNGFIVYRIRMSDSDMELADKFLTMYGEADSRPLELTDLTSHVHFNYVEAQNVTVGGVRSMTMRDAIATQLTGGLRLWHELPNPAAMSNNPLKTTKEVSK